MFAPRFYTQLQQPTFFSLIDDLERRPRQSACSTHHRRHHVPTFTPKFDLRETETHFELHGDLPGIEKDNVHIEFSDPQTLVVRGSVERHYTAGTPAAGLIDTEPEKKDELTEAGEEPVVIDKDSDDTASTRSFQATVEDEVDGTEASGTAQPTSVTTSAEVEKQVEHPKAPEAPKHKYWVSERSYGQFSRSFAFPTRVETEGIAASLNNGVLTVAIPKAKKHESYRISVL